MVITGMNNQGHSGELLKLLRSEEEKQKIALAHIELGTLPEIASWRAIYRKFGSNPQDFRSSVESLLRRARGGAKPLPQIDNLVDLYNYLSLKYHVPAGAEDLDKIEGDITLAYSDGTEEGVALGATEPETCQKGEVIYRDIKGFLCRRWNWREADRTKIEASSHNAILVFERVPAVSTTILESAMKEAVTLIETYLGGTCHIVVLGKKLFSIDLPPLSPKIIQEAVASKPVPISIDTRPALSQSGIETFAHLLGGVIYDAVVTAYPELSKTLTVKDIFVARTEDVGHGEYATNIAMKLAKLLKTAPTDIGLQVKKVLDEELALIDKSGTHQKTSKVDAKVSTFSRNSHGKSILRDIDRFEVAPPGFLNVYLSEAKLGAQFVEVPKVENSAIKGQKPLRIMVEFTDPNPFKEFHIGHLYSNAVGESVCRMLEALGHTVRRVCYQGDVGMHVSKSIWGLIEKMKQEKCDMSDLEKLDLNDRIKFLGQAYAIGATAYEEHEYAKEEMKDINYLVFISAQEHLKKTKNWTPQVDYGKYVTIDPKRLEIVSRLYTKGRTWSLAYFETIYQRLGTKFEEYYFESLVGEYGVKIVREFMGSVFIESDGAVVFPGEKYGLHTRVFINSLGLPTYEAKELGLAPTKYTDWTHDLSIIITAKEIDAYFQVLIAAISKVNPELGVKTKHMSHGIVRLPEGKMSSRTGKIVTGEWLLEEVKGRILEVLDRESGRSNPPAGEAGQESGKTRQGIRSGYSKAAKEEISEKAAVAAVKYSLLKVALPADLTFDFEKSLSFDGDSGPYLQYTYARCRSVLRKSEESGIRNLPAGGAGQESGNITTMNHPDTRFGLPDAVRMNPQERAVARLIHYFPEIVIDAASTFSPNTIANYLFRLASSYNEFYAKHSILTEDKKETVAFRLALTAATAQTIKRGLYLLGIETLERM